MYEAYNIYTNKGVIWGTKPECWDWIESRIDALDYDVRLYCTKYEHLFHEDNGPECESINEMEKYQ